MNNEVEIFKPGIAELKSMAEQFKGLTINGVEDEAGYQTVKEARKKLGDMRILITKTGKSAREEARRYASSVIEQEKEYLGVITPTEESLKAKIEAIDEEKKLAERIILLPSRKAMLGEIGVEMTDEEILALDEKEFSEMYTAKKMAHLEAQERKRKEEDDAKLRAEELEQAKAEAAKKATEEAERKAKEDIERVEKEKQAEIDKIKRDQEEKELAEQREITKKKAEEDALMAKEVLEKALLEKNRKYKKWLKDCGYTEENKADFAIVKNGMTTILYKKVSELTIK